MSGKQIRFRQRRWIESILTCCNTAGWHYYIIQFENILNAQNMSLGIIYYFFGN